MGASFKKTNASKMIENMVVKLEQFGRKNKKGFYDYLDDASKQLWSGLSDLVSPSKKQLNVDIVKKRLIYRQCLEACRCLFEGVFTDPKEADVGAILGFGFAPFSGGPLSYIEAIGIKQFINECRELTKIYGDRFKPLKELIEMSTSNQGFYH